MKQTEFYFIFYHIIVVHCPVLHWFDGIHLDNEHHQLCIVICSDPNISIALINSHFALFITFADHLDESLTIL